MDNKLAVYLVKDLELLQVQADGHCEAIRKCIYNKDLRGELVHTRSLEAVITRTMDRSTVIMRVLKATSKTEEDALFIKAVELQLEQGVVLKDRLRSEILVMEAEISGRTH